jgi:hypothetical protein
MNGRHQRRRHRGPLLVGILLVVTVPLLVLAASLYRPAPAYADTVNVTINIPATVEPNPCTPTDQVALAGQLHIVIATTADGQGGYHVSETMDEKLAGASLLTKIKYTASKTDTWDWYAGAPFPAVNTHTTDSELVSKAGTANFLVHITVHTTVDANGVPTVTLENIWLDCKG